MTQPQSGGSRIDDWIRERLDGRRLGRRSQQVIRAIAGSPHYAAVATVAQFGQRVGVDPATVMRVAKILGCNGWTDFQNELKEHFLSELDAHELLELHSSSGQSLVEAALNADALSLKTMQTSLDDDHCRTFATALIRGGHDDTDRLARILLMGSGSYVGPLTQFAHVGSRLGLNTSMVGANGVSAHAALSLAEPGDVLFVLNLWRTPSEVEAIVQVARSRGLLIMLITDTHLSQLASQSDHVLVIPAEGSSHFPSLVAASAVIHILLALITAELGSAGVESIRAHEEIYFALEEERRTKNGSSTEANPSGEPDADGQRPVRPST